MWEKWMHINADCLPCVLRQCVEAARMVTDDPQVVFDVTRKVAEAISHQPMDATPAHISETAHGLVKQLLHNEDPYRAAKEQHTAAALALLPGLRDTVERSDDRLRTAARLAAAGNVIDLGIGAPIDIEGAIQRVIERGFDHDDWAQVAPRLAQAKRIVYLGDNAGEVVFDRLFVEEIRRAYPEAEITFVVKPVAILNDATEADARAAGIHEVAPLTTTGQPTVGLVAETAPPELLALLGGADLIIAKGQANYESLESLDYPVVFILKAKCQRVADSLGVTLGDLLLRAHALDRPRAEGKAQFARDIGLVIFDLDGVLYRGKQVMPGAQAALARLRERGCAVRFLTNNSTQTRQHYVERLRSLGMVTEADQIMTSAYATALWARQEGWAGKPASGRSGKRVMVLGEQGLYDELKAAGIDVFWAQEGEPADIVVVGMDRQCTYARLEAAHRAIAAGARFVASNRDNTYPVEEGTIPGAGMVVAALAASTGVEPQVIGKPNTYPVERLLAMAGVPAERALIVGDRAETDIQMGLQAGLWTVLVLTGVTSAEQARALPPNRRPHRVIATLEELPGILGGR